MQAEHQKFFICDHCGNLVGMIESAGVPLVCCGEKMRELTADKSADASKHTPQIRLNGREVLVTVPHPMTDDHYVPWIYLRTSCGGQRKQLNAMSEPHVVFVTAEGEEPLEVFAFCNKHGLWRAEVTDA